MFEVSSLETFSRYLKKCVRDSLKSFYFGFITKKIFTHNFLLSSKISEAVTRSVLIERVFLEISQNSQENTGARVWLEQGTFFMYKCVMLFSFFVFYPFTVSFGTFSSLPCSSSFFFMTMKISLTFYIFSDVVSFTNLWKCFFLAFVKWSCCSFNTLFCF